MKWTNKASFYCPFCGELVECEIEQKVSSRQIIVGAGLVRAQFRVSAIPKSIEHACKRDYGPQDA